MSDATQVLDDPTIEAALRGLPEWSRDGESILRNYRAPSFLAGLDAVTAIGRAAEEADHHPDIDIRWVNLTFRLSTHSAGGLTAKDLDLARVIDGLLA